MYKRIVRQWSTLLLHNQIVLNRRIQEKLLFDSCIQMTEENVLWLFVLFYRQEVGKHLSCQVFIRFANTSIDCFVHLKTIGISKRLRFLVFKCKQKFDFYNHIHFYSQYCYTLKWTNKFTSVFMSCCIITATMSCRIIAYKMQ